MLLCGSVWSGKSLESTCIAWNSTHGSLSLPLPMFACMLLYKERKRHDFVLMVMTMIMIIWIYKVGTHIFLYNGILDFPFSTVKENEQCLL